MSSHSHHKVAQRRRKHKLARKARKIALTLTFVASLLIPGLVYADRPVGMVTLTGYGEIVCSGVAVSPRVVVSAQHCLPYVDGVHLPNVSARVLLTMSLPDDIALLVTETPIPGPYREIGEKPPLGATLVMHGASPYNSAHPPRTWNSYLLKTSLPWGGIYFTHRYGKSAKINHGDSGGAVTYQGKLIGVITGWFWSADKTYKEAYGLEDILRYRDVINLFIVSYHE